MKITLAATQMPCSRDRADAEGFVAAQFDLDAIRELRAHWGVFRDRRPELYGALLTQDGRTRVDAAI